ncbi:MAG: L,D-transpeptidase, partial [Synergistaceae bacterium]|nr:L,D-transpeptidase [Synergistaceae bacterium]
MDTQKVKDFFRDLFTLRTVWIDRGQGQWTVKKRMHPVLRGLLCTLALVAALTVYAAMKNEALPVPEPEPAIAKMIEPEKPVDVQTDTQTKPQNNNQPVVLPLKPIAMRREIMLPSEMNPDTDRIMIPVKKPEITIQHEEEKTRTFNMPDDGKYRIFVSKSEHKLWLLNGNEIVQEYPIATGKNPGDKQRIGDNRTPTGNFKIVS